MESTRILERSRIVDKWISTPCRADNPPFPFRRRGSDIGQRESKSVGCRACCYVSAMIEERMTGQTRSFLETSKEFLEIRIIVDRAVASSLDLVVLQIRQSLHHEPRPRATEKQNQRESICETRRTYFIVVESIPSIFALTRMMISFSELGSSCLKC